MSSIFKHYKWVEYLHNIETKIIQISASELYHEIFSVSNRKITIV